ncbi:MAG TPA: hypothetical protein VFA43_26260 [Gemmatimonadaceae bacterium]|nr:hypothetical protein [Gemmatimonadaceae bacterium]
MTRPHEDIERHTPTDHRQGGVPVTFAPNAWCAIDVVHTKAERVDAGISAYETLIEKARKEPLGVRVAAVLKSVNDRRVIALVDLEGHEAFRHLRSSWDDHHLVQQKRDVAESSALGLYRLVTSRGDASIDPLSKDTYAFEQIARGSQPAGALATAAGQANGFRGVLVFESDGDDRLVVIYRFGHPADLAALRADGDAIAAVHPVRTFG